MEGIWECSMEMGLCVCVSVLVHPSIFRGCKHYLSDSSITSVSPVACCCCCCALLRGFDLVMDSKARYAMKMSAFTFSSLSASHVIVI